MTTSEMAALGRKTSYNIGVNLKQRMVQVLAVIVIAGICGAIGSVSRADIHGNLSPELQEIVKLSQAQVGDDIIVAHIKNAGVVYHLSADDIIFLKGENVSPAVISALVQAEAPATPAPAPTPVPALAPTPTPVTVPAPTPVPMPTPVVMPPPPPGPEVVAAPAPVAPPAPEINFAYFHDQLAPWGTWIQVGGQMYWRPDGALASNPDWRPYYDNGQWVQTDNGLFWQSDYSWGDIPFHYGRWIRDPGYGWIWAPDYTWGPSWVFWRHGEADGCIGWAPLPPGAEFVEGGFRWHGAVVEASFDFGLGEDYFTFIGYDHFHERFFRLAHREYAFHIDIGRRHDFFGRSMIRNEFRHDEHGRFINEGIGHDRVVKFTKVEHVELEVRHPVGDREKLAQVRVEAAKPRVEVAVKVEGSGPAAKPAPTAAPKPAPVSKAYIPPATSTAKAAAPTPTPAKAASPGPAPTPAPKPAAAPTPTAAGGKSGH